MSVCELELNVFYKSTRNILITSIYPIAAVAAPTKMDGWLGFYCIISTQIMAIIIPEIV